MTDEDDSYDIEKLAEEIMHSGSVQLEDGRYLDRCSCSKNNTQNSCTDICFYSVSPHPDKFQSVMVCTGPVIRIEEEDEQLEITQESESVKDGCAYSPFRF